MSSSDLVQSEDRAHRRGQRNSVNVYFLIARNTREEEVWQGLSKQLACLSKLHDGRDKALPGLAVHAVKQTSAIQLISRRKQKRKFQHREDGCIDEEPKDEVPMSQLLVQKAAAEGLEPQRNRSKDRDSDDDFLEVSYTLACYSHLMLLYFSDFPYVSFSRRIRSMHRF